MLIRSTAALAFLLTGAASAERAADPLTRPIAVDRAAEWLAPRAPVRVFGNTYLVGFGGLSVALIDTGKGLILIDGALPQAAPAILVNVKRLGFRPRDIRYILSTEPHFDHAGGLAALARDTGAVVVASSRGAAGLRSGRLAIDDPQHGYDGRFPPVARVRVIGDGEVLRLGTVAVTARATPGHTLGSMTWTWQSCAAGRCKAVVFASSLNPVSADSYRYTARSNQAIVAGYRRSYATMRDIPCDILITAHADQSGSSGRFTFGPHACETYAERSRRRLVARIRSEKGSQR
ncbi:subclass B3 metallo-beta-lactamase [Sphingomonas sp. H39-1-10]|uniref:subclass B3 metallo-beta-lactamase n=1 Tax=Sphingomonas TaxID=13687 RepID=UPI0008871BFD|nr:MULTISPECIES: subclass B3 metallo-beta-lactamase [Sphingomonas]MDF0488883.1 subclass B3 metallo-beta-lactamase [Sphingomonas pollutisoli]SDA19840.1 metallo-beta-lactamase class B [Sphingomonas sp. NFR15]